MDEPEVELSRTLQHVVHRFHGLLKAVARQYGLSSADVDELAQEVRIRLWRALGDREKIAGAAAFYVQRTALSAAVDLIRRRRARPEESLDDAAPRLERRADDAVAVHQHENREEAAELRARLASAVDALTHPRDVVVRLHLVGYDRREIGALTGWSEPKVRNLLYRGLEDLRAELRRAGIRPREVA